MQQFPLELLAIAALILLNGFFAGAEIATVSSRRSRISNLTKKGSKQARKVQGFLENPDRFLATIQVGVTLAGTTASVVAGNVMVPAIAPLLHDLGLTATTASQVSVILVVALLSYLLLVIGELVPKYLGYAFPERLAIISAPIVNVFARLAFVPVKILSLSARAILWPLGLSDRQDRSGLTEEEINLIISEGHKEGRFEEAERDLVEGVFEFADTTVRQAMTPRIDIEGIEVNTPHQEILEFVVDRAYSRYPVYEDSLDNVKGIIHTKDIIAQLAVGKSINLDEIVRQVNYVPDSKHIPQLLKEFQQEQKQMAIVLDEFGGTAGLITIEDILEEIVGEIRDEHDAEAEPFVPIDSDNCLVRARYPIVDFNSDFGASLPEEGHADTVGGYVFSQLGKLPRPGEVVRLDDLEFRILTVVGPRIDRMRVRKLPTEPGEK
jgi:putative hemolysin